MVSAVYSLFKINIENLVVNKVHICRNWHIQPSEIEKLQYWEYEIVLKEIDKTIKEENKQQNSQNEKTSHTSAEKQANNMMRNANNNIPKMPTMNNITTPKIPKI